MFTAGSQPFLPAEGGAAENRGVISPLLRFGAMAGDPHQIRHRHHRLVARRERRVEDVPVHQDDGRQKRGSGTQHYWNVRMGPVTTELPTLHERTQSERTDQLAPVRLERGAGVAPAVEALAPDKPPVPRGNGNSMRVYHPGLGPPDATAQRRRATMFAGGVAGLCMVSAAISDALLATEPSLIQGWKAGMIASESMAPSSRSGNGVLVAPSDGIGLEPGTASVFDAPGGSGLVNHRTVGLNANGTYRTQGDPNGQARPTPLTIYQVVGVVRLLLQLVDLPINGIRQARGSTWRSGLTLCRRAFS